MQQPKKTCFPRAGATSAEVTSIAGDKVLDGAVPLPLAAAGSAVSENAQANRPAAAKWSAEFAVALRMGLGRNIVRGRAHVKVRMRRGK